MTVYRRTLIASRGFYRVRWAEGRGTMFYRYGVAFLDPDVPSALCLCNYGSAAGAVATPISVTRLEIGDRIEIGE